MAALGTIRRATADDVDAIVGVFGRARAEMTYLPRLHTAEEDHGFFRDVVLARQEVWVADDDGAVVGFAALADGMLEHLYVDPVAQRRGVGSELLSRAKERMPEGLRFWVFQRNEGARRFYERHGCRAVRFTDGAGNEEREPDVLYQWSSGR